MSCWTHVAAEFRIDALFGPPSIENVYEIVGKPVTDDWSVRHRLIDELGVDYIESFSHPDFIAAHEQFLKDIEEKTEHPERFLPYGSEGSLQMNVWFGPSASLANCTVSVFGDLRDYGSWGDMGGVSDIEEWFRRVVTSGAMFRQAVCTIDDEGSDSIVTLTLKNSYDDCPHVAKSVIYNSLSPSKAFDNIEWQRADIVTALKDKGVEEPTDEQIDKVIEIIGDNLRDRSTEFGWDIVNDAAQESLEGAGDDLS